MDWISVEDKLPNVTRNGNLLRSDPVWIATKNGKVLKTIYQKSTDLATSHKKCPEGFKSPTSIMKVRGDVTHWMPYKKPKHPDKQNLST